MRVCVCFIVALLALLASPQSSMAHGTERHFGNSLGQRPVARASPALSIMVIDASLSAIRRTLDGQSDEDIAARLEKIAMVTASLLYTTIDDEHTQSEFEGFASVFDSESEALRLAVEDDRQEQALTAFETLTDSFATSKNLFRSREEGDRARSWPYASEA